MLVMVLVLSRPAHIVAAGLHSGVRQSEASESNAGEGQSLRNPREVTAKLQNGPVRLTH